MTRYRLLVVDDEWKMRNLIKIHLKRENIDVKEAENGQEALQLVQQIHFDLIILDIMMPDMDGWQVCGKIRRQHDIPILMLTARTDKKDVVHGLNIGADDYLTKPFDPEELLARVHALLRRTSQQKNRTDPDTLVFKNLVIDLEGRKVFVRGEPAGLTAKEFELIRLLASYPKRVFTREMLIELAWGHDHFRDDRTVDTHVKNIREKIRRKGLDYDPIQTVWGVGYQFQRMDAT